HGGFILEIVRTLAGQVTDYAAMADKFNVSLNNALAVMSKNGFDETEIIRVLAGQLVTVAAMAEVLDSFCNGVINIKAAVERQQHHQR
ncbi:hypothetical protein Tco_0658759, partial [Tanacetum coccineum]